MESGSNCLVTAGMAPASQATRTPKYSSLVRASRQSPHTTVPLYAVCDLCITDGVPEVIGEDSPYRTWCNHRNRHYEGQCSYYARHPWISPGKARPYSPCSVLEIDLSQDARALPGNTNPTIWDAGSVVEAAWAIYANHGGGYQYRLCPLPASGDKMEMSEECFEAHPLEFAVPTVDLQNAKTSITAPRHTVPATRVREGVWPPGYEWAVNPIPAFGPDGLNVWPFDPLVPGACGTKGDTVTLECPDRVMNWRIIDKLRVPSDLAPGKYVLSMRWDSEAAPQIWAACSDIEIVGPKSSLGELSEAGSGIGAPSPSHGFAHPPSPVSLPPLPPPPPILSAPPVKRPPPSDILPTSACGLCDCHKCTPTSAYALWYSDWCSTPYYKGCDGSHVECQCSASNGR